MELSWFFTQPDTHTHSNSQFPGKPERLNVLQWTSHHKQEWWAVQQTLEPSRDRQAEDKSTGTGAFVRFLYFTLFLMLILNYFTCMTHRKKHLKILFPRWRISSLKSVSAHLIFLFSCVHFQNKINANVQFYDSALRCMNTNSLQNADCFIVEKLT